MAANAARSASSRTPCRRPGRDDDHTGESRAGLHMRRPALIARLFTASPAGLAIAAMVTHPASYRSEHRPIGHPACVQAHGEVHRRRRSRSRKVPGLTVTQEARQAACPALAAFSATWPRRRCTNAADTVTGRARADQTHARSAYSQMTRAGSPFSDDLQAHRGPWPQAAHCPGPARTTSPCNGVAPRGRARGPRWSRRARTPSRTGQRHNVDDPSAVIDTAVWRAAGGAGGAGPIRRAPRPERRGHRPGPSAGITPSVRDHAGPSLPPGSL